ncbi:MAG TPA: exonuclease SbcCD subunit D [Actinomycetota bacterium]|nr:exonuclease SbcCD subunit D [Actinomycetota bacterium]
MRFLHTADWHVGKKLGRIDRAAEFEQVIDEMVAIAKDEKVDVVLVAGDLLDRSFAPLDSIRLVIDGLIRLADAAGAVVAMPGNHDSPQLFELFQRLLAQHRIMLVPKIARPDQGGLVDIPSKDGSHHATIAVLPFLHEAQVVDFMEKTESWYGGYAERIIGLSAQLCAGFDPKGVGILVGHWFIEGAELGGGERRIHLGDQYAATAHSIPPSASYVALGHIHRPQQIVGSAAPARYAGSLLQLDFSERTHNKEVVIVDAMPGRPAKVKSIQLKSGRRLMRITGTIEELEKNASDYGDAYLDVRVKTDGPRLGLSEQVRKILPNAVTIQPVYDRIESLVVASRHDLQRELADVYSEYHASSKGHGVPAPDAVLAALRELEEAVTLEAS